jgi:hypothetical protein
MDYDLPQVRSTGSSPHYCQLGEVKTRAHRSYGNGEARTDTIGDTKPKGFVFD